MKKRILTLVILAVVAMALAACGDGESDKSIASPTPARSPAAAAVFPVTIKDDGGTEVTIKAAPTRVVALAPSFVEVLFALGAGTSIVAADENSDYPPEAASIPKVSGYQPSLEAITSYAPDLVLMCCSDSGGLQDSLTNLNIPTMYFDSPATVEGALEQIETIGKAAGRSTQAARLVAGMRESIVAIKEKVPQGGGPRVYHEVDNTYYTAGPGSFIDDLYATLGARNVAEATGEAYPQLSAEAIISANPEVIILADEFAGESPDTVAARAGWGQISAVKNRRVFTVDPNIVSRPGPRLVDALGTLERLLYPQ